MNTEHIHNIPVPADGPWTGLTREVLDGAKPFDFDDPEFKKRVDALRRDEQEKFDAWHATADYDEFIDAALEVAAAAAGNASREGSGRAWAVVEISGRTKPLILALLARNLAVFDARRFNVQVQLNVLAPMEVQKVAINAFVLELSRPGFEFAIFSEGGG